MPAWWQQFWRYQRHHNGFAVLQRQYDRYLTPVGKALFLLFILSLSLGLVGTEVLIYILFCLLFGGWLGVLLLGFWARPRQLQLRVEWPAHLEVGQPLEIKLWLRNLSRRPFYHLQVELQLRDAAQQLHSLKSDGLHFCLDKGEEAAFLLPWTPERRGVLEVQQLSCLSLFPLGLVYWRHSLALQRKSWVLPRPLSCPEVRLRAFQVPQSFQARASFLPDSLEFHGIRRWQPGDSPRYIHWPTLARTGQLAVREFQEAQGHQLALILDTEQYTDPRRFEQAVSLAAGFVLSWDGSAMEQLQAVFWGGHQQIFANVQLQPFQLLQQLAELQPGASEWASWPSVLQQGLNLTAVVYLMSAWQPEQQAFYRWCRQQPWLSAFLLVGPAPAGLPEDIVVLGAADA